MVNCAWSTDGNFISSSITILWDTRASSRRVWLWCELWNMLCCESIHHQCPSVWPRSSVDALTQSQPRFSKGRLLRQELECCSTGDPPSRYAQIRFRGHPDIQLTRHAPLGVALWSIVSSCLCPARGARHPPYVSCSTRGVLGRTYCQVSAWGVSRLITSQVRKTHFGNPKPQKVNVSFMCSPTFKARTGRSLPPDEHQLPWHPFTILGHVSRTLISLSVDQR